MVTEQLFGPAMRATEALVRLDERIARSPVAKGFVERSHFADAASSLWLDGELVHVEDLVLHDAHMDLRAPTHELTRAHEILRLRRQILSNRPDWALGREGFAVLCGRGAAPVVPKPQGQVATHEGGDAEEDDDGDDRLSAELAALDAALGRAQAVLDQALATPQASNDDTSRRSTTADEKNPLIYDADWDEPARLAEWQAALAASEGLPALVRAAIAYDAWTAIAPLQHAPWLGRLLVAALLRQSATTTAHLVALHVGARTIARERRFARDRTTRLVAFLDGVHETAAAGMKEHDRLVLAKAQMDRRLKGRRSTSRLPEVIALVLSRPLVSSGMIEKELGVTTAGALNLIGELELREITGRGRYRAWGVI
nr:RHE_PE00001 family protein [Aminobacter niigataensis]